MRKYMAIYTKRNPDWMNWIAPERFDDNDLFRIVIFFVFHSPCADLSSMRKTLLEYGWTAPWKKPYYLNKQLKQAASQLEFIYSVKNYNALEDALKKAEMYEKELDALRAREAARENEFQSLQAFVEKVKQFGDITALDKVLLNTLIEKIVIGERQLVDGEYTQEITIYYKFDNKFQKAS